MVMTDDTTVWCRYNGAETSQKSVGLLASIFCLRRLGAAPFCLSFTPRSEWLSPRPPLAPHSRASAASAPMLTFGRSEIGTASPLGELRCLQGPTQATR